MSARFLALILMCLAGFAQAQGFAGLGTGASGFSIPHKDTRLQFPRDHGAHPDFRIEWWYLTATLTGDDGQDYGIQWTLFRSALRPEAGNGWSAPQLWMGHAAVTGAGFHLFDERLSRGGIGQAGVTTDPFAAWIDDWRLEGSPGGGIDSLSISARGADFAYLLNMKADKPLVFHGDGGYSVKSAAGQASHYYSQPSYTVEGVLNLPEGAVSVSGQAWLDREWSSQPLAEDQSGWDWFSLSFSNGERLMTFRLRGDGGDYTAATWIDAKGQGHNLITEILRLDPLEMAQVDGRQIPVRWRVQLAEKNLDIVVSALNPQSWMGTSFPYWEGPVSVTGSHTGKGYLEMTGYQ